MIVLVAAMIMLLLLNSKHPHHAYATVSYYLVIINYNWVCTGAVHTFSQIISSINRNIRPPFVRPSLPPTYTYIS
jgi:hypothetical protein